jgi:hypothetical protein
MKSSSFHHDDTKKAEPVYILLQQNPSWIRRDKNVQNLRVTCTIVTDVLQAMMFAMYMIDIILFLA